MSDPTAPDGSPPPPPEPGPGPAGAPTPAGSTGYGSLGKRFLARIIDGLLVGVSLTIVMAVIPGVAPGGLIGNIVTGVGGFAYFVFLETSQGATFGKQWLGMRVTEESGASPISTDASLRRNWWLLLGALGGIPFIGALAGLASLIIVIVIAATISSDPRNQGWHDKLGGTLVADRAGV